MSVEQTLAAADLDGDHETDGAVLVRNESLGWAGQERSIELHFTGRENSILRFESNEPAQNLYAVDVNRDGATDIVVEQGFTHKRLQVWLNDGRGNFHHVRIEDFPSHDASNGERVTAPSQQREFGAPCISCGRLGLPLPGARVSPVTITETIEPVFITPRSLRDVLCSHTPRAPPLI